MAPEIQVCPEPSMADSEVDTICKGLPANSLVTVRATSHSGQHAYESFGVFQVDEKGEIDLSRQPSLAGSYCGVDKMGLFWSMDPSPENEIQFPRFLVRDVTKPVIITIRLYVKQFFSIRDLIENNEKDCAAKCQVNRMYMKAGTKRVVVQEENVEGTLFIPPGKGPFPGVVYILGAVANPIEADASLMSSHGFVTFNLKYFGFNNWVFHINMERLESVVKFLSCHPAVDSKEGVSVVGLCKGGQFALCMAECLQGIKSVVAINSPIAPVLNCHHYKTKTWPTLQMGDVLPYVYGEGGTFLSRYAVPMMTDSDEHAVKESLFKFYNRPDVRCLIVAALDDGNIPSEHYCNYVERLLKEARHPQHTIIRYPGAGHLIEPPYTPFCFKSSGKPFAELFVWGGSKIAHCRAQVDCWGKIIDFLSGTVSRPISKL